MHPNVLILANRLALSWDLDIAQFSFEGMVLGFIKPAN